MGSIFSSPLKVKISLFFPAVKQTDDPPVEKHCFALNERETVARMISGRSLQTLTKNSQQYTHSPLVSDGGLVPDWTV